MKGPTLLYDSDCGFCRWSVDKILRLDRRDALRTVPLQSAEANELLGAMDAERKMASWHLVDENGRVRSAGAGVGPLLRLLPGGRPLAIVAERFPKTTDRFYRIIARNRDRFGRILGAQACSVDPSSHTRNRA